MRTTALLIFGLFLKMVTPFFLVDKNIWIFGSKNGEGFGDNSKYLYLYVLKHRRDVVPIWISRRMNVINKVLSLGGKAYLNYSFKGLYYCMVARYYFFSTNIGDIYFVGNKKGREIVNLWHGMPIKKIVYDHKGDSLKNTPLVSALWKKLVIGFTFEQIHYNISTSDYFSTFLRSAFNNEHVYVTGQPRNDIFFDKDFTTDLKKKLNLNNEKIITYMPTHRNYGHGKRNPIIFSNDSSAQLFFSEQKIVVLCKLHPNMKNKKYNENCYNDSPVKDISNLDVDPQELLFLTDILITDYSSCVFDFVIMKRPVILFHYDDYEHEDNALYFDITAQGLGSVCTSEHELLYQIKKKLSGNDEFDQLRDINIKNYHSYLDGKSSQRIISLIQMHHNDAS